MIVQDFVAGYALLPVLVDVEAVVVVLAKELVLEVVQGAVADAPGDVMGVVIPAVQVLVTEDVQEVVPVVVLLVLTVVLITAQVVAAHCVWEVAQGARVDVLERVKEVVRGTVRDVQEVAQVVVVVHAPGVAGAVVLADVLGHARPLCYVVVHEDSIEKYN